MEGEEDDYMSMNFADSNPPNPSKIETSIQRRARKQREAELKSRVKSKAEIAADEAAAREAALSKSLDSSNKGFQMMAKLGFKGGALGKSGEEMNTRTEPIGLVMKEDRGGVGLDAEKKRKFREEAEHESKRFKAEEGDYRERLMREREEKKIEGKFIGAMVVAEGLDEEAEKKDDKGQDVDGAPTKARAFDWKPLSKINVLWRSSVKHRIQKERDRRMRYDLQQSLSRLPTYEDPEEDEEFNQAMGKEEEDVEEEDPELDEFLALEAPVRLAKLVDYLRGNHHYCFWCKYQYPDESMEGCPGITEEEHD